YFDLLAVVGRPSGAANPAGIVAFGPPADVLSADHVAAHFGVGSVQVPHPTIDQLHLLIHPREDISPA
ncbi:MAG TPA: ABC transporter ATP-binding protein, partial [Actinoplanes sp.]|nr:ABC transporter ATP-binding protein [Actinoplanes sp.]